MSIISKMSANTLQATGLWIVQNAFIPIEAEKLSDFPLQD